MGNGREAVRETGTRRQRQRGCRDGPRGELVYRHAALARNARLRVNRADGITMQARVPYTHTRLTKSSHDCGLRSVRGVAK